MLFFVVLALLCFFTVDHLRSIIIILCQTAHHDWLTKEYISNWFLVIVATLRAYPTSSEKIVCDQLIYCCFTFKSSFRNTYICIETYGGVRISGVCPSTSGGGAQATTSEANRWGSRGLAPGGGCKRAAPPCQRKSCILRAKYA